MGEVEEEEKEEEERGGENTREGKRSCAVFATGLSHDEEPEVMV